MKRKRKVYGAALPPEPLIRKSYYTMPSLCIACGKDIDLADVQVAINVGQPFSHSCGRLLYDPTFPFGGRR